MSKVLCLDQATKVTGYSVWVDGKLEEYGNLEVDEKLDIYERMYLMAEHIESILNIYKPSFVVFEDIQEQKGKKNFQKLAQMQGIVIDILNKRNIGFTIVWASEWRKCCGIKGKNREEYKPNTQKFVLDKYGIEATEDEADAIGIGEWAMANLKGV